MTPDRPQKRSAGEDFMASIMASFEIPENVVPESPPPMKKQKLSPSLEQQKVSPSLEKQKVSPPMKEQSVSPSLSSDSGVSCDWNVEEFLAELDSEVVQYVSSEQLEAASEDESKDAEDDPDEMNVFFDEQAYYEKKERIQREEEEEKEQAAVKKAQEIHYKYFQNYFWFTDNQL